MCTRVFQVNPDLMLRLKNGDESAFSIIYKTHFSKLYSFIFSFLKQKELTEEVLQETFLAIWLQRETLDIEQPIEPLLFMICRRKVLDSFRKATSSESLRQRLLRSMTELVNNTEETVFYHDVLNFTNDAISKLPKQQQLVVKLNRIDGLSYDEIAVRMQLSRNTVKNHLVTALKTLRVQFDEHGFLLIFLLLIPIH